MFEKIGFGVIIGLGIFMMFLLFVPITCYANMEQVKIPLYAGYSDNVVSGQFFLGSGSIENEDMVFFWINENGTKHKESRYMSHSTFIEDDGNYLLQEAGACPKWTWRFVNNMRRVNNGYLIEPSMESEFHVPQNSIIQMYQFK